MPATKGAYKNETLSTKLQIESGPSVTLAGTKRIDEGFFTSELFSSTTKTPNYSFHCLEKFKLIEITKI